MSLSAVNERIDKFIERYELNNDSREELKTIAAIAYDCGHKKAKQEAC
jgi:hypothetical protein